METVCDIKCPKTVAQVVERFSRMHEFLGSIPKHHTKTKIADPGWVGDQQRKAGY